MSTSVIFIISDLSDNWFGLDINDKESRIDWQIWWCKNVLINQLISLNRFIRNTMIWSFSWKIQYFTHSIEKAFQWKAKRHRYQWVKYWIFHEKLQIINQLVYWAKCIIFYLKRNVLYNACFLKICFNFLLIILFVFFSHHHHQWPS